MRVFGHPLHPMLVHFPIAFWTAGSVCDGLALLGVPGSWPLAWLAIAIGVAAALPAAVAGLVDIIKLDGAAPPVAGTHMMLMVSALTAYAVALFTHSHGWAPAPAPSLTPVLFSWLGFVLLAGGGHFGAALVYRYGAGAQKRAGE